MSRRRFDPLMWSSRPRRSPLASIRRALVHFAERRDLSSTDGCMGINAICEFGMGDEEVTRITRRAANAQRHTLMDTLRRAQMEGELDAQADIESLADFFESTLAGIRIAAKAGKTRPALKRIAEVASVVFDGAEISVQGSRLVGRDQDPNSVNIQSN